MTVVTERFVPLTSLVVEARIGADLNEGSHTLTSLSVIVTNGARG